MRIINKKIAITALILCFIAPSIILTTQSGPPPTPQTYSTTLESNYSVYISEYQPTYNYNSGTNKYYLDITVDEFTYSWVSFVKFDLSSLPDDAEVLDAEISLYLTASPDEGSLVKMYPIRQYWSENSVTWNTRPSYKDFTKTRGLIDTINISTKGWKDWDATSVVEDWLDGSRTNYGVAFETDYNIPRFRSDESSYEPSLYILYRSSSGEEPEDPPEDPPEDTTPCEIEYTINPENPQNGDEVTISVTATDDIGLEYLAIKEGSIELCSEFAEDDETKILYCNYTENLYVPGKTFFIEANDLGSSSTQLITLEINVEGTGSNPIVTLDIAFDEDDAIPEKYRLLPMDGQEVSITATATDPDGIDFMTITCDGMPYDFSYDPPQTEVEETINLINGVDILDDCSTPCTLRYSVRAYDIEDLSTRVEGEDIEVNAPWQWYWGLPFANWGSPDNHTWSWTMMESIFGEDDVWIEKGWGWKRIRAERLFDNKVKEGGRGGQCYGMCALSLEFARPGSGLYANYIQDTAVTIDGLERENWDYTWRYYYARQAGQYSKNIQSIQRDQWWDQNGLSTTTSSGLHPHMENVLDHIIDDLNDGNPGMLGIRGSGGHAVVPWRVVPGEGDEPTKIFIYDPNRPHASTHDSTDYSNTGHYPFIECGVDSTYDGWWSYVWNSTSTWDDNIYYYPYNEVVRDTGVNYIGSAGITDQRLPSSLQITSLGSGSATYYAEDSAGRKTGHVNGEIVAEIPYSYPILEYANSNNNDAMFIYPSNITLTFHVESTVELDDEMGSYSLMLWDNSSFYALDNASCTKDTKDEVTFTPRSSNAGTPDYSFKFLRSDVTELRGMDPLDYSITIAKEFYNSPKLVAREYIFTSGQNDDGAEIELYISEDYDDLIVETFGTPFSFSVTTKSSESLEDDPDVDFIPKSKEDFSMGANEKLAVTPDDWATTSATGSFTTGDEQQDTDDQTSTDDDNILDINTPGFEVFVFMISLLFCLIWGKRRRKI